MLSSTEEYLGALRQEDYLGALGWIDFLIEKYSLYEADADSLIEIAIFELIYQDFRLSDLHHIKRLYVLLYEQVFPFTKEIAYKATLLCNATIQYWVYLDYDLIKLYKVLPAPIEPSSIKLLMQTQSDILDEKKNEEELLKKFDELNKNLELFKKDAFLIRDKIQSIFDCTAILNNYLTELRRKEDDVNKSVKTEMVESTYRIISAKTIFDEDVQSTIGQFLKTMSEQELERWEKEFIAKLSLKLSKPRRSFWDEASHKLHFFTSTISKVIPSFVRGESSKP